MTSDRRLQNTSMLFFFNDTATTEIYTLSLHDALPLSHPLLSRRVPESSELPFCHKLCTARDRKSTRLNSSHVRISYAVFCLKKKKKLDIILPFKKKKKNKRK